MIGPGKYDKALKIALRLCVAHQGILIVLDGAKGAGFSAHLEGGVVEQIPEMLRQVARSLDRQIHRSRH